jgi:hypothetical protein
MYLDDEEFYNFLKNEIVKRLHIKPYEMTFFKHEKLDKNIKEIHRSFPYLKHNEVAMFMELVKNDESYNSLLENLGLTKSSKKKLTKKDKIELNKIKEQEDSILDMLEVKHEIKANTFIELLSIYNKKLKQENNSMFSEPIS